MQLQLFLSIEGDHHADGHQTARLARQAWTGPDLAPGIAGNQVLELTVEIIQIGLCAIDMLITKHRATDCHPVCVSLFVVHGYMFNQ
jgi:hypothetical protein